MVGENIPIGFDGARQQAAWRRGWCPTATSGMVALDGQLLRVRPPLARLDAAALDALADIADAHADGHVLLTRRAKLGLRGIRDEAEAIAALAHAGLVEDDAHAALPDRLLSPVADWDDTAVDVTSLAAALDRALMSCDACASLAAKFALAVDGGGRAHVGDFAADIRIDAVPGAADAWRIALAGDVWTATALGCVTTTAVPGCVRAIVERFVARAHDVRRMRAWPPAQLRALFADCVGPQGSEGADVPMARAPAAIGPGVQHGGWLLAGFAFGRMPSAALRTLAQVVRESPSGDIRITPTRSVMLSRADAAAVAALRACGAIVTTDDSRYAALACVGQAGCQRATTPTRAHALRCTEAMPHLCAAGALVHVSGCAKGCARREPATVTLVARQGAYDVVFAAGPQAQATWTGLAMDTVVARLGRLEHAFRQYRLARETADAFLARLGKQGIQRLIDHGPT